MRRPERLKRILAQAKGSMKDAASVNSTRWALVHALKATGPSAEVPSGGRTNWNQTPLGLPKTHTFDALGVGMVDGISDWSLHTLVIKTTGLGSYQLTRVTSSGFPRGDCNPQTLGGIVPGISHQNGQLLMRANGYPYELRKKVPIQKHPFPPRIELRGFPEIPQMNVWLSVSNDLVGSCSSRVWRYISKHLQSPKEAGCLALLPTYRDEAGLIHPHFFNLPLWRQVGHKPGVGQPERALITNLCMGMDAYGNQLTETELFCGPVEILVTLPSELSQALEYDPQAAHAILWAMTSTLHQEIERVAILVRVGGRRSEVRPAQTLSLAWLHALNQARESHFQSHSLFFTPANSGPDNWHAYQNRRFMLGLHALNGTRAKVTKAMIREAARRGYQVEMIPGGATPDEQHGARVTCPSGLVIHPGSIPRQRGAEVHAQQALRMALGAPMLTCNELPLLLQQAGQYPSAAAGGQRQDLFLGKLEALKLLDSEGRIKQDLFSALSRLDVEMAKVEASLLDLPFQERVMASQAVRKHRERLRDQVPAIRTDEWLAYHTWTTTYDDLLELVATKGINWSELSPTIQSTVYLLARAGVAKRHWEHGQPAYRLTKKGEARRQLGLQEAAEIKAVVPELFANVSAGDPSPEVLLGRLHLAGVYVHGSQLQFRRVGRVVEAGEQIQEAGIDHSTPVVPDFSWWQWYWDHRHDLPSILARVVLHPEELPAKWLEGSLNRANSTSVPPQHAAPEGIYYEPRRENRRSRSIPPQRGHVDPSLPQIPVQQLTPVRTPGSQAPSEGKGHVRNR